MLGATCHIWSHMWPLEGACRDNINRSSQLAFLKQFKVWLLTFLPYEITFIAHEGKLQDAIALWFFPRSGVGPARRSLKIHTSHSSEKSWGGRLVERPKGLPVQPLCGLVILEGEASVGVELPFQPCPSNNIISPQEDRLRLAVSRRSTSRGWPAMPPSGPTRASRCRATRATRAPGLPGSQGLSGPQERPEPGFRLPFWLIV